MDSIMIQCTGRFTTTIIHIIVASMILLATIPSYNVVVLAEPADLGTFGSHNDFPQTTYAIKSDEQRMMVDFVYAFINYTYTNGDGKMISISNDQAKYGEGQIKNVGGRLIHLTNEFNHDDHSACTPEIRGTHGDELPMPGIPWIALIRRGNCTFEEKVRHAFIKRAIGVIIYNDRETNVLDKMKILDKDRNITAVITLKSIGDEMAKIVEDGYDIYATISRGKLARPLGNINKTSVFFVSISFIVLMIISFVWLVFYYVQRFRYLQTKDRKSRQMCTVAKRIIAKIPTKNIKSDESSDMDSDCCAICIEPYKATDVIRVLPCRHEFHKCCIDPWLLEHRTCPMCKMDILKYYGFVFTGSQESIIQLDMDTEDGGDDNQNDDIIRARSASPSLMVQLDHEQSRRRHSVDTFGSSSNANVQIAIQRHSIHVSGDFDDKYSSGYLGFTKLYPKDAKSCDDNKLEAKLSAAHSLPCTLKKCKSATESPCRGSNNCYVWPLEDQKFNTHRSNKLANGCPKSQTACGTVVVIDNNDDYDYDDNDNVSSDGVARPDFIDRGQNTIEDKGSDNQLLLTSEHAICIDSSIENLTNYTNNTAKLIKHGNDVNDDKIENVNENTVAANRKQQNE